MKKAFKKIFAISFICFLLIQFYQPARNKDNGQVLSTHFVKAFTVPKNVETILQNSCYDCHSNNTKYLWYDNIQPARMLVERHIRKGKENLNFSEWGNYSSRKQENKLDRIVKQLKANKMPLASYILLHKNAKLSVVQKSLIINWINNIKTDDK
jgi:hypothetical protein